MVNNSLVVNTKGVNMIKNNIFAVVLTACFVLSLSVIEFKTMSVKAHAFKERHQIDYGQINSHNNRYVEEIEDNNDKITARLHVTLNQIERMYHRENVTKKGEQYHYYLYARCNADTGNIEISYEYNRHKGRVYKNTLDKYVGEWRIFSSEEWDPDLYLKHNLAVEYCKDMDSNRTKQGKKGGGVKILDW